VLSQWQLLIEIAVPNVHGPLEEYDERVHSRALRDDEHQRGKESINIRVTGIWLT
jgi:hypothetical protein